MGCQHIKRMDLKFIPWIYMANPKKEKVKMQPFVRSGTFRFCIEVQTTKEIVLKKFSNKSSFQNLTYYRDWHNCIIYFLLIIFCKTICVWK